MFYFRALQFFSAFEFSFSQNTIEVENRLLNLWIKNARLISLPQSRIVKPHIFFRRIVQFYGES